MWWRPALLLPVGTITADTQVYKGPCVLYGWAWAETTGGAGSSLDLYDGNDAGGALIVPLTLTSGQSTRDTFAFPGIAVRTGLFIDFLTGSTKGTLWYVPVRSWVDFQPPRFAETSDAPERAWDMNG